MCSEILVEICDNEYAFEYGSIIIPLLAARTAGIPVHGVDFRKLCFSLAYPAAKIILSAVPVA